MTSNPRANGGSGSSPAEHPLFDDALARVTSFAAAERMFRRARRVMVALSGGPDSLACLLLVRAMGERDGFEVVAAHFDHQLRPGSAADLERARAIAGELGVECVTGEGDVASVAREQRMGIEETARRMRYQFLAFVAGKENADCLVTGHTADDQAETVLMRVVRGTGIRGLRGMGPVAGIPGASAQRLVRPLLCLRRDETRAICDEAGIEPVRDPSNDDPRYTRNRLRAETLPALRQVNPSVDAALLNLAESARQVFEGIERQALELRPVIRGPVGTTFKLDEVRALPVEAITLVIEREAAFGKAEAAIGRTRLRDLRNVLAHGSGLVPFGPCVVEVSCGQVRIGPPLEDVESFEARVLDIPGSTAAGPWRVDVSTEPFEASAGEIAFAIGNGTFRGLLRVRQVQPGDRIRLHGMRRRVSDVLINRKAPRWERPGAMAIADADGLVALAGAFGVVADQAPDPGDALFVRIRPAATQAAAARLELPGS